MIVSIVRQDLVLVIPLVTFWTPTKPSYSEATRGDRLQHRYLFHQESETVFTLQWGFRLNHEISDNSPTPFPLKCPGWQIISLQFTGEQTHRQVTLIFPRDTPREERSGSVIMGHVWKVSSSVQLWWNIRLQWEDSLQDHQELGHNPGSVKHR